MSPFNPSARPFAVSASRRRARCAPARRRGMSMVLMSLLLIVLAGFVSLAVDVGRVRLAKSELQTAADAAAFAGANGLIQAPQGVDIAEDGAITAGAENKDIDVDPARGGRINSPVTMVPDEDVEFGIWRPQSGNVDAHFEALTSNGGGVDERREANAVRAWGRRVTSYVNSSGNTVERGTGLKLMFAPVLPNGPTMGEIQAKATAMLTGGDTSTGFVGIDWVKFNGGTGTDSFNADTESYPGVGGPNKNSAVSSDGDIELDGNATIWGDAHPGIFGSITPSPLSDNVVVTGYMNPLDYQLQPLYPMPAFSPKPVVQCNLAGSIDPPGALKSNLSFAPNGNTTLQMPSNGAKVAYFYFKDWTEKSKDNVTIDNRFGQIFIWVDGDFTENARSSVQVLSDTNKVFLFVNGNLKMDGGGILQPATAKPNTLNIFVTKANTSVSVGGSPTMSAHIYAPGSDVKVNGNANGPYGYFGTIVGKSLFVTGGSQLHYDETGKPKHEDLKVHLVE